MKETMKWIFGILRVGFLALGMTYFNENFRYHAFDKTKFFWVRWGNGILESIMNFFGGLFGRLTGKEYYEEVVVEEEVAAPESEEIAAA